MVTPKCGLTHVLKPCGARVPASMVDGLMSFQVTTTLQVTPSSPQGSLDPSSVPMGPCLLQGGIQVSRGRKGPLTPYPPTLLQLQSESLCSYLFPVENFRVRFCLNKASRYYKHFADLRSSPAPRARQPAEVCSQVAWGQILFIILTGCGVGGVGGVSSPEPQSLCL